MANKYHGQVAGIGKVPTGSSGKAPPTSTVNERPGFKTVDLPGKTQSRDRSGGVKRCPAYPNSKGI
jgi:hypothetical protein